MLVTLETPGLQTVASGACADWKMTGAAKIGGCKLPILSAIGKL